MENRNYQLGYFLVRITIGVNMLGHGLVRLPKIDAFATWMTKDFEQSWLPASMVHTFGTVLPFLEFILGIFLTLGIFTYRASIVGGLLIAALIFGSSTIENWEAMGMQMIYALFFAILVSQTKFNYLAIDSLFNKKKI